MAKFKCPPRFSLVVTEWVDASILGREGGWNTPDRWDDALSSKPHGLSCSTVGWLLRRDPLRIVIAQSYNEFGHLADCISIPIGCVQSIRILEVAPRVLKQAIG